MHHDEFMKWAEKNYTGNIVGDTIHGDGNPIIDLRVGPAYDKPIGLNKEEWAEKDPGNPMVYHRGPEPELYRWTSRTVEEIMRDQKEPKMIIPERKETMEKTFDEKFEKCWAAIALLVPRIARGAVEAKKDMVKTELRKEFGNG